MDYQNKIHELERKIQILETGINNTRDVDIMNKNRNKINILKEEIEALKNKMQQPVVQQPVVQQPVVQQPVVQQPVVQQPVVQLTLKDLDKMIVDKLNEIKNETDKDKLNTLKKELEDLRTRHASMKGGYNKDVDYKRLYLKYKSKYLGLKNKN